MKHLLKPNQVAQFVALANQATISIHNAIGLISAYIFDIKGEIVRNIDPTPTDKFEEAVSLASNYFILVGEKEGIKQNQSSFHISFGGDVSEEQKEFLRKNGMHI